MPFTASFHNGGKANFAHNRRDSEQIKKEKYTSVDLKKRHITLIDEDIVSAYNKLFGDALEAQNERHKRSRHYKRIITMEQYIESLKIDRAVYLEKIKEINLDNTIDEKEKKKRISRLGHRPGKYVYEAVITIGNVDTIPQNENERIEWNKKVEAIYTEMVDRWNEKNPNIHIVGAFIHIDEAGAPHMHLDYIPVAHNQKRGLETAPRLMNALLEQGVPEGVYGHTTQQIWQDSMRDWLVEICAEYGIDAAWEDRRRQGIFELKEHHLDPFQYKMKQMKKANDKILTAKNRANDYEEMRLATIAKMQYVQDSITEKFAEKTALTKEIAKLSKDVELLKKKKADVIHDGNEFLQKKAAAIDVANQKIADKEKRATELDAEYEKKELLLSGKIAEIDVKNEKLKAIDAEIEEKRSYQENIDKYIKGQEYRIKKLTEIMENTEKNSLDYELENFRLNSDVEIFNLRQKCFDEYVRRVNKYVKDNPNQMSDNFKEELKILAGMYNNTVNDIMIKHGKEAPYPQKDFGHDDDR